jgi:hypothetical protein
MILYRWLSLHKYLDHQIDCTEMLVRLIPATRIFYVILAIEDNYDWCNHSCMQRLNINYFELKLKFLNL